MRLVKRAPPRVAIATLWVDEPANDGRRLLPRAFRRAALEHLGGPRGDGDARARRVERGFRGAAAHLRPVEARRRAQLDGGWTSRARRHLERPGSSGDVAALQEGETPANGAGG